MGLVAMFLFFHLSHCFQLFVQFIINLFPFSPVSFGQRNNRSRGIASKVNSLLSIYNSKQFSKFEDVGPHMLEIV